LLRCFLQALQRLPQAAEAVVVARRRRAVAAGAEEQLIKGRAAPDVFGRAIGYAAGRRQAEQDSAALQVRAGRGEENARLEHGRLPAPLLATDPLKSDTLGRELTQELYAIFRREREQGVQAVLKEDVAEVLRRRFFKPESIRNTALFRPQILPAVQGIAQRVD